MTNSFHGTLFSIIYRKAFYSMLLANGNAKIRDLLKRLHLENRIFEATLKLDDIDMYIDYTNVTRILEKEKEKSFDFLRKALED